LRILRSQLEKFIEAERGLDYLLGKKAKRDLPVIRKEIAELREKLAAIEARTAELERVTQKKGKRSRAETSAQSSTMTDFAIGSAGDVCRKGLGRSR
jgi:hypothetical protein